MPRADRLMLLDTASLYFRAFYGVPDKVKAPDGSPVNAARGLLDIIAKLVTLYEPTHVIACWDDDWRPQWRVDLIPSYKTHRVVEVVPGAPDIEEVPDPLEAQIPLIRQTLATIGIPIIGVSEHEADDVIGTLATDATMPVDIVTGDRDLFQLVDDSRDVRVIYTARGMSNLEIVTDATVVAKYGVLPSQYADFATMRGDASDGLPGVAGVGDKTAATLLQAHADLTGIREAADAGEGMSAGVRGKILAASDYLDVAPTVVAVATTLPISAPEIPLHVLDPAETDAAAALADKWNLGSSMSRAVAAVSAAASARTATD
ncbi:MULTISPECIES: 5'-3' exonuclease [unclassified Microbacterium]|uniref:5'-3' exonuclease n=1 Tax=unclassified Microbacterium TaxID=2609290 RepID=UPI000EAA6C07|nr:MULTISPECIES: 5'-3' exonuclease [unclassified Microbacterium]RKN69020.1 5'-3' exonuclease [Microbacterium sp. CGR2]